jgi:hypothetical protein
LKFQSVRGDLQIKASDIQARADQCRVTLHGSQGERQYDPARKGLRRIRQASIDVFPPGIIFCEAERTLPTSEFFLDRNDGESKRMVHVPGHVSQHLRMAHLIERKVARVQNE